MNEKEDLSLLPSRKEDVTIKSPLNLPKELFLLPLVKKPFFPGMAAPIVIEPGRFYELIKSLSKGKVKSIGLVLSKKENVNLEKIKTSDLYKVGVLSKILRITPIENGGVQIILSMEKRLIIKSSIRNKFLKAKVSYEEDLPLSSKDQKAYSIAIINTMKDLVKLNPLFKEELQIFLSHSDFTDPGKLADFAVALTTGSRTEQQDILETFSIKKRIDKALILLKKEIDLSHLLNSINEKIETNISQTQKEFFLREQLRAIKRELGIERDDKDCEIERFQERLKTRNVPENVKKTISEEIDKLQTLDMQSSEYALCRSYLDWLTIIPWGVYSKDSYDIKEAESLLNQDHYGLEETKKRILEFIAVGKLSGNVRGNIMCFVGPPGVGKTSIGKSIAKALNRKFYRFSVGGMRDEAEVKGHRRTYVGAMPGKLIQALKYCQTMNPVILLDEVDKMGKGVFQGDPASALLEVLDSEQNIDFLDHYLDVRCDLSSVLFITTANVLDSIPPALKDRMDIMRLPGYILQEKVQIAKRFLIPKHRKEMGLKAKYIKFTTEAIKDLANGYARESGVRSLENFIKKVLRKIATAIVKKQTSTRKNKNIEGNLHYSISRKTLKNYVGKPIFTCERYYKHTPPGVCTGLAWTALGGAILYIEVVRVSGEKISIKLTGQAGDVMKESSQIAWTYLHSALSDLLPDQEFFKQNSEVHMHIPEGATPKDGPSAGITMVTALLSLLTQVSVPQNLGMTGELTLTGRVLAIGGLKEKIIAARRSNIKTIIFPKDNLHDFEELPDYLKKGLNFHQVQSYLEVFDIVFPSLSNSTTTKKKK